MQQQKATVRCSSLILFYSLGQARANRIVVKIGNAVFILRGRKLRDRAQGFVEYALLTAIAIIGLLVTVNSFLKGSAKNSFNEHFNTAREHIVGE
ncbi:MAG: hypothetical protein KKE64_05615 [Candidatus Omnitrophica bacterium]|nr:hypothetical protein [Candidatus Omnitrophota bacterium]